MLKMSGKKKKILIMYDFFSEEGGVERIMSFQARTLKKAGYSVSFAFAYVDERLKKRVLKGFPVLEYGKLSIKNETLQISTSIFRSKPLGLMKDYDLIICHSFPSSFIASRLKKHYGVKVLLHLHHPPQFLYSANKVWASNTFKRQSAYFLGGILKFPLRKFDQYCVNEADGYLAECTTVNQIINRIYGINGEIIYPPVNNQFKYSPIRDISQYGIKGDYILGSGRIVPQKRFDFLIKAISKLKRKNLQVVLAGKYNPSTKRELEIISKELGVSLVFLGSLSSCELREIYSSAKATVLTCPREWFGLVPIEAMRCGCPVLAWKDGFGPEETIIEGINGFLSEPYDLADLSKNIQKAISVEWDKKKIISSIKKFEEKEQAKKLRKFVTNFLNESSGMSCLASTL